MRESAQVLCCLELLLQRVGLLDVSCCSRGSKGGSGTYGGIRRAQEIDGVHVQLAGLGGFGRGGGPLAGEVDGGTGSEAA